LAAPDLAQLRALELEFDLKALDVLRAVGEARARLRFAERELERLGRLRAEGLSTQQQIDLAEQNLAVAKNESEAAAGMQASLDALVTNREGEPGADAVRRFPLVAPIGGTVVEVRRVPGESVAPDQVVFRILDSSRLWIEGRVLEFDLEPVTTAATAVATFGALPGRRFELAAAGNGAPYVGKEVDPLSRTVLVRYELDNPGDVRVGMLADLELATGGVDAAVSVPFEAVVMDQGMPTAYVMLGGELFQKRDLELGVRDGAWVEVLRGIEPGERAATRGAYLVKLAALSPASFGPGHAH
jgi:multidrug efflux pump subunit AcrA (membrane-fusion protein)